MSIIKLAVGTPIVMKVTSTESVKGNFRQEIKFTSPNGDAVFIGEDVALRQLGRFALAPQDVAGKTLKFEKVEKEGGKKFINIDVVAGNGSTGGSHTATQQALPKSGPSSGTNLAAGSAQAPATPQVPAPSGHELYAKITAWVLKEIVPQYKAVGITPTQEGTAAICATLFINANGRH